MVRKWPGTDYYIRAPDQLTKLNVCIDYYCRTRQTDKTPHSVLEKMKEAENFSYSMNFGHFSIQVGISPSEVISAQKMKWAVKL